MKQKLLFTLLSIFTFKSFSQDISYGILVGANIYQSDNNNREDQLVTLDNKLVLGPNLGGYLDYGFKDNLGIKTELSYNKKEVSYKRTDIDFELSYIDLSPSLKYNFGPSYNQGFHMTLGPRFSFLINNNIDEAFKTVNVGAQLGLGYRIIQFIELEGRFDYGCTPYFKLDNGHKSKFFGTYISMLIDLSEFFSEQ